ncbi:hypothetical protein O181_116481 [Austropuccinia psidii MF-1]|uniref:Uncharacterized protein n=1 Tax=Austropuccinia psidii MF-1 TaxID=1389203 RepID=A0A9Q3KA35_9BASI|nr:hypothetical protein [Austropuccinia psidii MF-1]
MFGPIPQRPQMAIDLRKPRLGLKSQGGQNDYRGLLPSRLQGWPLEVTRGPQPPHKGVSPQDQGNPQRQLKLDSLCRNQGWYIYGIIVTVAL